MRSHWRYLDSENQFSQKPFLLGSSKCRTNNICCRDAIFGATSGAVGIIGICGTTYQKAEETSV